MIARIPIAAVLTCLMLAAPAESQQTLVDARELYATAAYDEALTLLDRLKGAGPSSSDLREIEQFRALCLLALKRQPEAEKAIEALVAVDPFYRPAETEAAPWVRASFTEVRRRLLPATAQRHYVEAKAFFGMKEYGKAAAQLNRVIAMLEDPDLGPIGGNQTLEDLRTLAQGFLELSQNALAKAEVVASPEPPAAPPQAAPQTTAPAAVPEPAGAGARPAGAVGGSGTAAAAVVAPLRIYSVADSDVTPPTAVFQRLPLWPSDLRRFASQARGLLELVIDESGLVEAAVVREPINQVYDALLVEAARTWRYTAATRGTQPVKYRRLIEIRGPNG